jgi:hypothetical protein
MKKSAILFVAAATLFIYTGCGKSGSNKDPDYTCTTCTTTPEAKAANDASFKGVYKGVLIGSTGTIKFDVNNAGTTLTATLVIDGVTSTLTATVIAQSGQTPTYVSDFTGTLSGQPVTIKFSVGSGGQNPVVVSATVPGHTGITFVLVKETSTALIEAFEGTYETTKPESGTFNIILSRKLALWGALARKNGSTEVDNDANGTISGDNLVREGITIATIAGDALAGEFTDGNNKKVTLKGKRTL